MSPSKLPLVLRIALCLGFVACPALSGEKEEVAAVVQRIFDAMAAHDGPRIEASFTREGRLTAIRETGESTTTDVKSFASRIASAPAQLLERMWNPEVRVSGRLATLWAPYDFHRDGKRTHCGIDQVELIKTSEGWKVLAILYTVETTNCPESPLGPIK